MNLHVTSTDLKHIEGFQSCMKQILNFLEKETGFKPEKRYFDAAKLLEEIQRVSAQIHEMLNTSAHFSLPVFKSESVFDKQLFIKIYEKDKKLFKTQVTLSPEFCGIDATEVYDDGSLEFSLPDCTEEEFSEAFETAIIRVSHLGELQLTPQQEQEAIDELNSINEFGAKMHQVLSEKQNQQWYKHF